MKSVSSMFKVVQDAEDAFGNPEWTIGFKYWVLDDPNAYDIDIHTLMEHFGYAEEARLWNSYYTKYPDSVASPYSDGIDNFFFHLMSVGIFEPNDDAGKLVFTSSAQEIYEEMFR